ncbi:MAG: hypothetical protein GXO75_17905 [Calditrichaeota bacterium]|nr:hypothetical protein [Calditrichota bacterium]
MKYNRREFLHTLHAGLFSFAGSGLGQSLFAKSDHPGRRKKMIFGWTTCLTYETHERKLGFDYFSHLLDEMKSHGMTRLIVMMASHGNYSPGNHGIAWPIRNPKLKPQVDKNALNAFAETEFFSRIIEKAHRLGIEIFMEIKYLGMAGLRKSYPGVKFLTRRDESPAHSVPVDANEVEKEAEESLHICHDNEQAHTYMRDKIADVLQRYPHVNGIVLEHPSYFGDSCYCSSTREKLFRDTGKDIYVIDKNAFLEWKNIQIRDRLIDLKTLVKSINPRFQFGFYSGFSPRDGNVAAYQKNRGHSIETLKQVGLDFVMPYCEGRHRERETMELEKVIEYLSPLKIYLHTTIRRNPPRNYPLPPKDPAYIERMIRWGKNYFRENERFMGMTFFNEVNIPEENRRAVYEHI